ncbi:ABC transporter substrate-binding protein [Alkalihalobacterium alkalinitrilicum]|uniref:ABC transporter substrate-binding protein n=1 Tax=Alkalihalobacterium alkalinitrilicum TaxID=427920 RepID=UPI000995B2D0|nr:ABC transporter substrate-binding protein [Alkalihalobacterium alkalinitrilicum]
MRLEEHYLILRVKYSVFSECYPFNLTIHEVADLLACSERNAKLIMKNMKELGWITWEVFKGRGKKPLLTFLYSKSEMEHFLVKDLIQQGKYTEVIEKLNKYDLHIQEELEHFLEGYFGLSLEQEQNSQAEIDVLRCPIRQKVKSIDPLKSLTRQEHEITQHLFDSLFTFDYESQSIQPHICFHWEHSEDGTEWFLYIRKGVYFHHGRCVDAHDVKFTIEHLSETNDYKDRNESVHYKEITVINKYALKITLNQPNYLLLNELCSRRTSILPKEWKEYVLEKNTPIGTGPYKVLKWSEERIILVAHEHYFQMRPHIDRIELIYVNQNYQTDSLLFSYPDMYHEGAHWKPIYQTPNGASYLSINTSKPGIHNHPAIKKALYRIIWNCKNHATDELTRPAYHFLYEQHSELGAGPPLYDTNMIEQLLTEADYQGEVLNLVVPYVDIEKKKDPLVEKIISFCRVYGIHLEVQSMSISDLLMEQHRNTADIILVGVIVEEDIVLSLTRIFSSPLGFICNTMAEKEQQDLFSKLDQITTIPKREDQLKAILAIEQHLIDSNKVLLIHHNTFQLFYNEKKSMEGINLFQTGGINYSKVWYKRRR